MTNEPGHDNSRDESVDDGDVLVPVTIDRKPYDLTMGDISWIEQNTKIAILQ